MLQAPFPWFGGKHLVAPIVWAALGDVSHYAEPFFGSGAVLLGRPHEPQIETVNDIDHWLANFWRAVQHDPEAVAHHADWPCNEDDLTARHIWLMKYGQPELAERLPADPDYYDAKMAGWWVWGLCNWIGHGWCAGTGPWTEEDGKIVRLGNAGRGVMRKLPHLGDAGVGVMRQRPLVEWMQALAKRLRRVRVCCGDWERIVTDGALHAGSSIGIFLDPPYSQAMRDDHIYRHEAGDVPERVLAWCLAHGDNPRYRIALCGYDGEHNELEAIGWRVHLWKAGNCYGTAKSAVDKSNGNASNRGKERIWFSPACLDQSPRML